jgi:hypothetical protein
MQMPAQEHKEVYEVYMENTTTPEAPLNDAEIQAIVEAMKNGASIGDVCNIGTEVLEGLYTLAYNLYTSGNFVDAETVFQALCLYRHSEFRFWMGLAGCRQANGNQAGAIDAYSMAGVASGLSDPTPLLHPSWRQGKRRRSLAGRHDHGRCIQPRACGLPGQGRRAVENAANAGVTG